VKREGWIGKLFVKAAVNRRLAAIGIDARRIGWQGGRGEKAFGWIQCSLCKPAGGLPHWLEKRGIDSEGLCLKKIMMRRRFDLGGATQRKTTKGVVRFRTG